MTRPAIIGLTLCFATIAGPLVLTDVVTAQSQTGRVPAFFEQHGLFATFALDCGRPASKDNLYYINVPLDAERVQRITMNGSPNPEAVMIIDQVSEPTGGQIYVSGTRNGEPADILWRVEPNRTMGIEASIGGRKVMSNGRSPSSGREAQWLTKCSAPGQRAGAAPAMALPPAPPPGRVAAAPMVAQLPPTQMAAPASSVQAIFEKYGLLGQFSWDCKQPPSKSNLYYVNTLIENDRVRREQMSSLADRDWVTIIDRAKELRPNEIYLSGVRDNVTGDGIWRVESGRMLQWEAAAAGKQLIANGKTVSNGRQLPWIYRCGG